MSFQSSFRLNMANPKLHDRQIQWLLDFRSQDLSRLPREGFEQLAGQITWFCNTLTPKNFGLYSHSNASVYHVGKKVDFGGVGTPRLRKADIVKIHSDLRQAIDSLVREDQFGAASFPGPDRILLLRHPGRRWIYMRTEVGPPALFWYTVAVLLAEASWRLQICPECKTLFLAKTKRKAPCSKTCSRKGRNRRWYEDHRAEMSERRHQAYMRQVRKKFPKAKVKRRT
jgi:hypothetical protein